MQLQLQTIVIEAITAAAAADGIWRGQLNTALTLSLSNFQRPLSKYTACQDSDYSCRLVVDSHQLNFLQTCVTIVRMQRLQQP